MNIATPLKSSPQVVSYRPSIVTFIDILGFRSIVANQSPHEIFQTVERVQQHAGYTDEDLVSETSLDTEISWTRCVFFSDSVVRVRPIDVEFHDGSLFHELIDLVHAQGELAHKGIFIRGGLTVGDIHQGDNVIFGPAMVRAYDLESSYSDYPRIVIDPIVLRALRADKRLRSEHNSVAQELEHIKRLVRKGDDGLYFIDYLGAFQNEMDEPSAFPEYLAGVKAHIVSQAVSASSNLAVLKKFLWMAKYLNAVAAAHFDYRSYPEAFITSTDIPDLDPFIGKAK